MTFKDRKCLRGQREPYRIDTPGSDLSWHLMLNKTIFENCLLFQCNNQLVGQVQKSEDNQYNRAFIFNQWLSLIKPVIMDFFLG